MFIVLLLTLSLSEGAPISHGLPSFEEISLQSRSDRKQYLNKLAKLINNKKYDFLDGVVLLSLKKEKHCFSGIYGEGAVIRGFDKNSRQNCKQNLDLAGNFF